MIIDYKLTYPSGTATAHLINSFHTPEGAKLAKYTSWDILSNHLVETIFIYGLQSGILYKWTTRSFDNCRKQVKVLGKFFSFSFLWSFFQWFYTAAEDICGFAKFPTFGLQAFNNRCKEWYMIFFFSSNINDNTFGSQHHQSMSTFYKTMGVEDPMDAVFSALSIVDHISI